MKMLLNTLYGSGAWDEKFSQLFEFRPGETENRVINLYPEAAYQTFEGFGGAITEAAGYVYSQMDEKDKNAVMEAYFATSGMNYRFVRIPIDSCDFSLGQYEGFERVEKYIIPMLRDAEKAHGSPLGIMLAPWSPPAKWKTSGIREQGGSLKREHYAEYAAYLCDYIEWYKNQGFLVTRLSLQNEAHAVQTWDSCVWTAAEQKEFLRDFMWPEMEKRGMAGIEIYLWDHNKERVYEWLRDVVDEITDKMVAGIAFHWYSGDQYANIAEIARRYPAIDPLDSWSHYNSVIEQKRVEAARAILRKGNEVGQMMKVVGEEGTSIGDFIVYLKAEFLDAVYLQQNAFSESDASTPVERQRIMFDVVEQALLAKLPFGDKDKDKARSFFMDMQQAFIDWNDKKMGSQEFESQKKSLLEKLGAVAAK